MSSVGEVDAPRSLENTRWTRQDIDRNLARCPDSATAARMEQVILDAKEDHDSTGGVVTCVMWGVPKGLGEPCFDKLEAMLAHGMLSIPATKGFEIGSGFRGVSQRGSEHNDMFVDGPDGLSTATNNSGGVQGGITNGQPIVIRVAFKPPATIGKQQQTANFHGNSTQHSPIDCTYLKRCVHRRQACLASERTA